MSFRVAILVTVAIIFPNFAWAAADHTKDCEWLKKNQLLKSVVSEVNKTRGQVTSFDFRLDQITIAFTTPSRARCVALYRDGAIEFVLLPEKIEPANGQFDIFNLPGQKLDPGVEKVLRPVLDERHIETALVLSLVRLYDAYGGSKAVNTPRVHFGFLVHEAFHGFGQRGSSFNQAHFKAHLPYVGWTSMEARRFIEANCTTDVVDERASLREAFHLTAMGADRAQVAPLIRRFLRARSDRYARIHALFQPEAWPEGEGCAKGESVLEELEGAATFIEFKFLMSNGLATARELTIPSPIYTTNSFYDLGAYQLFVLERFDPEFAMIARRQIEIQSLVPESIYTTRLRKLFGMETEP